MKRLIALLPVLLVGSAGLAAVLPCDDAHPLQPTLRWRAPAGQVDGYRVYRGTVSKVYTQQVDLPKALATPDAILSAMSPLGAEKTRTYFYAMRAWNAAGESALSNEVRVAPIARTCPAIPRAALEKIRDEIIQLLEQ